MWSIQPGSSSPAVHGSHMDLGILSPGEVHGLPHLSTPQPENVPPAAFWIPGYLQTPWKTPLSVPLGMQGLSPGSLLMQSPPWNSLPPTQGPESHFQMGCPAALGSGCRSGKREKSLEVISAATCDPRAVLGGHTRLRKPGEAPTSPGFSLCHLFHQPPTGISPK